MDNEVYRQEYVMNQIGMFFYGSKFRIGGSPWNFGQVVDYYKVSPKHRGFSSAGQRHFCDKEKQEIY